tara:strand:- start:331 stop:579 length:249 start_codon:yes stop_codon:yes gene_type:complete
MEYDNSNRGSIFKNDKKEEEKHPDMTGSLNVDGKDYWISAWKKTSKAGTSFLSLSVRPKQEDPRQSSQPTRKTKKDDLDDFF